MILFPRATRPGPMNPFLLGILLMIATCAVWGLAFVAPIALPDASAIEVTLGRTMAYGAISLMLFDLRRAIRLPRGVLWRALVYALTGNVLYYFLLVLGMQWAGASMGVLVIGMAPVTVTLAGRLQQGFGALKPIAVPLALFCGGLMLANTAKTDFSGASDDLAPLGVAAIFLALVMWTWYAVVNARFLQETRLVTPQEWSSVIGIVSLAAALVALPVAWATGLARLPGEIGGGELAMLALWSLLLGGGSTWLGTVLFNMASKVLDLTILGQMIIFEAVFGMIYVFVAVGEVPTAQEFAGIAVALFSVWLSIRRLYQPAPRMAP
ncbi:DMT family transporter [Emcibacter sp. SYSU 3D8]|uniref:DMT family transporter n=1 Tax=Emcibacter sp. SYSU 3D8 TaxID=3133969 RepID=UPI0031FEC568